MHVRLLEILRCPSCGGPFDAASQGTPRPAVIEEGRLRCAAGHEFPIRSGVPDLRAEGSDTVARVAQTYGYLWGRALGGGASTSAPAPAPHVLTVAEVMPRFDVPGPWALEVGCGTGRDGVYLAGRYPDVQWVGVDIHPAITALAPLARRAPNLQWVRASATRLPFASGAFGFAYSYGVLHHLERPQEGFAELARVLRPEGRFAFYVYEAHEETWWKRLPLRVVTGLRRVTTRLPHALLYRLCWLASPLVVCAFTWPARLLARVPATRRLSARVPFHFGRGPFSVAGDLYDRFASPIEHRLTRRQLAGWFGAAGIEGHLAHPREVAGWVGWGRRAQAGVAPAPSAARTPALSLIILCYRAEEYIRECVASVEPVLRDLGVTYEIILVANYTPGDEDRSPDVARALASVNPCVRVVAKPKEGMMGWDMRSGLEAAAGQVLVLIDGDGQIEPQDIGRVYRTLRERGLDLCQAYRVRRGDGWRRVWISRIYNAVFRLLFPGTGLRDVNAKPKVMTRRTYEALRLSSTDWFTDADIIIQVRRLKLRVGEIPSVFGHSAMRPSFITGAAVREFLKNLLIFRVRETLRGRGPAAAGTPGASSPGVSDDEQRRTPAAPREGERPRRVSV